MVSLIGGGPPPSSQPWDSTRVWTLAWLKPHEGGALLYNLIQIVRQSWHRHILMKLLTHEKSSKHRDHFSAIKQNCPPKVSGSAVGKSQEWPPGQVMPTCGFWDLSPGSQYQQGTDEPQTKALSRCFLLTSLPNLLLYKVYLQDTWQAKHREYWWDRGMVVWGMGKVIAGRKSQEISGFWKCSRTLWLFIEHTKATTFWTGVMKVDFQPLTSKGHSSDTWAQLNGWCSQQIWTGQDLAPSSWKTALG